MERKWMVSLSDYPSEDERSESDFIKLISSGPEAAQTVYGDWLISGNFANSSLKMSKRYIERTADMLQLRCRRLQR